LTSFEEEYRILAEGLNRKNNSNQLSSLQKLLAVRDVFEAQGFFFVDSKTGLYKKNKLNNAARSLVEYITVCLSYIFQKILTLSLGNCSESRIWFSYSVVCNCNS
jgi:hypothetical protein